MLTLPAAITSHLANEYTKPVTQAVFTFPGGYVKRIANVAHTYGGQSYTAELLSAVKVEQTLSGKFDNASFEVENQDGAWSTILNSYTVPEIQQTTLAVYQTFLGLTDRVQLYSGVLDVPQDVNRKSLQIKSTQILNSVTEQFNRVVFAPTCQWAVLGLFAGGTRCTYAPGSGVGRCGLLTADVDDAATDIPVDHDEYYLAGEYIQVDSEIMLVNAVTTGNLSVTRARKDTTAASHSTGDSALHNSCLGSYEACKCKNLPWLWSGYAFIPMRGTYTYGQHVFLWKWNNITAPWEAQYEKGLYGSPWSVVYGQIKAQPLVISFKDTGFVGCYLIVLGHGQIENVIEAPTSYPIGDTTPAGGGPYIVCNGKRVNDYGIFRGLDGVDMAPGPTVGWDNQGLSGYWDPAFPNGHETATYDTGQTLSRMAYLAGAFPSRPEQEEGFPEILVWMKGRKLQAYDSAGAPDGAPAWTNNPAWVLVDMLTNAEYGAGVPTTSINWPQIVAAAADYTAAGFEFNAHLTQKIPLVDALKLVCNACRSFVTYSDGLLGIKFIKPTLASTGVAITSTHVIAGSWKYWASGGGVDRDANVLEFQVQASEYDYQAIPVTFVDEEHVAAIGKRKSAKLDVTGITNLAQAQAIGAFNLNLCKMARRQDGARILTVINRFMALQPGDILNVDLSDCDGQAATDYLVWSTRRVNNAGDIELELVKWDAGLFELGGIGYDTPTTLVNPGAYPVDVSGLSGTISQVNGQNHCSVSWTWTAASGENPEPVRVYLYSGDASATVDTFTLLTPDGVQKPTAGYTWDEPARAYTSIRVVAVAQSAFGIPANPIPAMIGDAAHYTQLAAACDETATTATVDDGSALGIADGDLVCMASATVREFAKAADITGNTITFELSGGVRVPYCGSQVCAHAEDDYVSAAILDDPYCDLTTVVVADSTAPGAPGDIQASAQGSIITVAWTKPATNVNRLSHYLVYVGIATYVDGGGGVYSFAPHQVASVPPSQTTATVTATENGWYAVGVSAVNDFGEGPLAILWKECD